MTDRALAMLSGLVALSVAALVASTVVGHAGPCSRDIDRVQARLDATLERRAGTGRTAPESTDATMHRQPTPGSIAAAEERLGELSARTWELVRAGMARARAADAADDRDACEKALAEVQRAIGP